MKHSQDEVYKRLNELERRWLWIWGEIEGEPFLEEEEGLTDETLIDIKEGE